MQVIVSPRVRLALPLAVSLCFAACEERILRRGEIVQNPDNTVEAVIPSVFSTNNPNTVTVFTFGNSCVEQAHTKVTVTDLVASIEPYDWEQVGATCLDILLSFPHRVDVVFARSGTATIQFIGRGWHDSVVTVERTVLVR